MLLKFIQFALFYWNFAWIRSNSRFLVGKPYTNIEIEIRNKMNYQKKKMQTFLLTRSQCQCAHNPYTQSQKSIKSTNEESSCSANICVHFARIWSPEGIELFWLNKHAIAIQSWATIIIKNFYCDKQFPISMHYRCELTKTWLMSTSLVLNSFTFLHVNPKRVTQVFNKVSALIKKKTWDIGRSK